MLCICYECNWLFYLSFLCTNKTQMFLQPDGSYSLMQRFEHSGQITFTFLKIFLMSSSKCNSSMLIMDTIFSQLYAIAQLFCLSEQKTSLYSVFFFYLTLSNQITAMTPKELDLEIVVVESNFHALLMKMEVG